MLDSSHNLENEDKEILSFIKNKKTIILLNKSDLEQKITPESLKQYIQNTAILSVSVKQNKGLEQLTKRIKKIIFGGEVITADDGILGNVRHTNALYRAKQEAMQRALTTITTHMPEDFISMDLQQANAALGEITGDTVDEEIIDRIFTKFCLGKVIKEVSYCPI